MVNSQDQNSEPVSFTDTVKLCEDIASLYLSETFVDVVFIVEEERLYAHRVILQARSSHFKNLFEDNLEYEITIADVTANAFQKLLKFIYTGTIVISSEIDVTLEVLGLAHQYSLTSLESGIIKNIQPLLNLKHICAIFNAATLYDLEELKSVCLSFMDANASQIVASDCFSELSQKSMIKLLERDTFFVPEIQIFKSVAKWWKTNNDVDDLVLKSVRLSWLSVGEVVSVVWPSKLIDNEVLLHAIAEIVDVIPRTVKPRGVLVKDENIATLEHGAEVSGGTNTGVLLTGTGTVDNWASFVIDGKNSFIVKLNHPFYVNHISMRLWDNNPRNYSYYIEVSLDQKKWRKIVDYSRFPCRSYQKLFFDEMVTQYIKIVGTHNTANEAFHLISFETYYKSSTPQTSNGVVHPEHNVATLDKKASVIEGGAPNFLLNGDTTHYDSGTGYTHHTTGTGHIVVQLAQPYVISSMRLLLWDKDGRSYRYLIETSVNKTEWEIAVDRRNEDCKSWQNLEFDERVVVYVRITGTHNTNNNGFHCVHFECPSDG